MAKVRMADGTVVEMSASDISAHNASIGQKTLSEAFPGNDTAGGAFADRAVGGFMDNLLNIPGAAGNALAHGAAGLRTVGAMPRLMANDQDIGDYFGQALQQEQGMGVAGGLNALQSHIPDAMGIQARMMPGDAGANREALWEQQLRQQENFPLASTMGDIAGDAATLVTGRAPMARLFRNNRLNAPPLPPKNIPPGIRKQIDDIVNSKFAGMMKRGGRRAGETGAEGAALALLNDGDPIATAAYGAGTQMAGSMALTLMTHKVGLGVVGAAALGTSFLQMLDSAIPGGDDYILPNIEAAYNHLTAAIGVGVLSGLAGTGRLHSSKFGAMRELANNMPMLADAITAAPRGAVLSMIKSATDPNNPTADTERMVIEQMARDPEFFGPTAMRRIGRSMTVEKAPSLKSTLEDLMENRKFREKLDELSLRRETKPRVTPGVAPGAHEVSWDQGGMAIPNPAGIAPPGAIEGAISRAESVPPGAAMSNAQGVMAQQAAARMVEEISAASIPLERKSQLLQMIGDPSQMTMDKLQQIQQTLGGR